MIDKNEIELIIEQIKKEVVPVGSILIFSSEKVPDNYLPCDGRELPKQLFPELYALIGSTWGETESTFFLPDLQGQFVRGWDREQNVDPERKFGSCQEDALQGHSHRFDTDNVNISIKKSGSHHHSLWCYQYDTPTSGLNKYKRMADPSRERGYRDTDLCPVAGEHSHDAVFEIKNNPVKEVSASKYGNPKVNVETRPKNIALMYCIKAK